MRSWKSFDFLIFSNSNTNFLTSDFPTSGRTFPLHSFKFHFEFSNLKITNFSLSQLPFKSLCIPMDSSMEIKKLEIKKLEISRFEIRLTSQLKRKSFQLWTFQVSNFSNWQQSIPTHCEPIEATMKWPREFVMSSKNSFCWFSNSASLNQFQNKLRSII